MFSRTPTVRAKRREFRLFCGISLLLGAALGACGSAREFPAEVHRLAAEQVGASIDLDQYRLTFSEEFDALDASGRRCDTRWIAHTPWDGDFGAARFLDPARGEPFAVNDGILRIEARKQADGQWTSGLLSSWNTCGGGFAQQYGYFEIRAMLPGGVGLWPAFWLIGIDRSRFTAEIDVFEHQTLRPWRFSSTLHIHPRSEGVKRFKRLFITRVEPGSLYEGFNRWGVSVEPEEIILYFNGEEIGRVETLEGFKQPVYMLLNLAMIERHISEETPNPAFMYVDYVRAYERR